MQFLVEESQVYFSANEWGSVGTILKLLIFLCKVLQRDRRFCIFRKGRTTVECPYIFRIAFNVFVQLMKFYFFYQMKIQMKIRFN